jgi:acetyltransferase-like isoleucine patch superfamily enzyme
MLGKRPEGLPEAVFVHPLAFVESTNIGAETRVWAFAHVMKDAKVGTKCNLGEQVFVENGAVIGNGVTVKNGISVWDRVEIQDEVFLGPHMVFTNDLKPRAFIKLGHEALLPTVVEKGATIGAGATIVCGVRIGQYAFVAAGAVVTKDIPAYGFVKGNPARLCGYVCKCAKTTFLLSYGAPTKEQAPRCPDCGTRDPRS